MFQDWKGGKGVTSAWSPLGNFLEGQAHPNLSSNQVFLFFLTWSFLCFRWYWGCYVYFRIVFSSNSLYILYIFIFIYFIYFSIVLVVPYSALTDYDRSVVLVLDDRPDPQLWGHCRSTHNSSMIWFLCLHWFLFGILAMDGMAERNHCHIIKGFPVASWRIMQHVIEKPLPYN